jgi:hypothetical protein
MAPELELICRQGRPPAGAKRMSDWELAEAIAVRHKRLRQGWTPDSVWTELMDETLVRFVGGVLGAKAVARLTHIITEELSARGQSLGVIFKALTQKNLTAVASHLLDGDANDEYERRVLNEFLRRANAGEWAGDIPPKLVPLLMRLVAEENAA